jgi:hypothetical protein
VNNFRENRILLINAGLRLPGSLPTAGGTRAVAKFWLVLLALVVSLVVAPPAQALTILVTYDSSVSSLANAAQVEAAFAVAAQTFQSRYSNPITVNITVYWGNTGPFTSGIGLGASRTQFLGTYAYTDVTSALSASRTSSADNSAVASLPLSNPTAADSWLIPTAEVKALGLPDIPPNDPGRDGEIGFASDQSYTFDPTNRAVAGKYDFIGVAEHEIAEVLGRVTFGLNTSGYVPYDLFRFTANGTRSFDPNGSGVYFSIDNGATQLKSFNPASAGGDIQDWATGTTPDAYDAFASNGKKEALSSADVTALDIIGYDVRPILPVYLTGVTLTNGTFRFGFTNTPGAGFTVLTSTNPSLSLNNWTVLGTPTEGPAGLFQFTDSPAGTVKQRFYRVSSP